MAQSFLLDLVGRYFDTARLFSLSIDLTRRCQLNCYHCYLSDRSGRGDLGSDFFVNVIAQARKMEVVHLLLSGGEPMLLDGWEKVLEAAKKNNMMTGLFTHAGMIGIKEAKLIKNSAVYDVAVSVYSMNAEEHDRVTRIPGSYKKTMVGIRALLDAGVHVTLRGLALKGLNGKQGMSAVQNWVLEQNRPEQLRFVGNTLVMPRDDGDMSPCHYTLETDSLVHVLQMNNNADSESLGDLDFSTNDLQHDKAPLCGAGLTALHVESNGEVRPCMALRDVIGDLQHESLAEVWQRQLEQRRNQGFVTHADFAECKSCAYKTRCRPCQALSQLEHGSRTKASHLQCIQTHAIAIKEGQDQGVPPVLEKWRK